jgi:hypothetical protein
MIYRAMLQVESGLAGGSQVGRSAVGNSSGQQQHCCYCPIFGTHMMLVQLLHMLFYHTHPCGC